MAEIRTLGDSVSRLLIRIDTERFSGLFNEIYGVGYQEYLDGIVRKISSGEDYEPLFRELRDRISIVAEKFQTNNNIICK
jgi:hypothetical protein